MWEAIQSAQSLQQKLQGVTELVAIVVIVKDAGFTISAVELQTAQAELSGEPLAAGASLDLQRDFEAGVAGMI
ncbi:Nif11-like leader peptide family RiPP precursor [bacterium]|nr:Nif11-like leader peptide family RiPP precursor [bacterium]